MNNPVPDAMDPEPDTYRVGLLPATKLLALQLDAARGDEDAQCMVTAVLGLLRRVVAAPGAALDCACCSRRMNRFPTYYIGIIIPGVDEPSAGLGFLVCDECGFTAPGLDAAV